ncbi:hypothetical protein GCM10008096_14320 [Zhihengliuella salsuginis]|uniref:Secreted protein n=1 Tax=Zhihengliuella salsuginis TaxID=578222 RepID=A0ABQ3GH97_9MICC|nr:hypothetical protein GCM10008096_14320 [Zhihengliuella salsuginis]
MRGLAAVAAAGSLAACGSGGGMPGDEPTSGGPASGSADGPVLRATEVRGAGVRLVTLEPLPGTSIGIDEMGRYGQLSYDGGTECWLLDPATEEANGVYGVGWTAGAEPQADGRTAVVVPSPADGGGDSVADGDDVVFSAAIHPPEDVEGFPAECVGTAGAVMWIGDMRRDGG